MPTTSQPHLAQLLRLWRDIADVVHPAGVAVVAVQEHRHVDVHDVAVLRLKTVGRSQCTGKNKDERVVL